MARQSSSTVINWIMVFIGALFVLPRALAAVKASNSAQRASTVPTAAASTQAARAINTAGYAGNTWLARYLSQLLGGNQKSSRSGGGSGGSGQKGGISGGGSSAGNGSRTSTSSTPSYISYVDPAQIHQPDFAGLQQQQYWEGQSNVEAPDPMTVGGSDIAEWNTEDFWWLNDGLPSADNVVLEPDALTVGGYYGPDNPGDLSALDFLQDNSNLDIPIPEMVDFPGDGDMGGGGWYNADPTWDVIDDEPLW